MPAVLPLRPSVHPIAQVPADPLAHCTDKQRQEAMRLEALLMPAVEKVRGGLSPRKAGEWLARVHAKEIERSAPTVRRYLAGYLKHGVAALVDGNIGRRRKDGGWEAVALEYYRLPSQPCAATIALKLRDEHGFADATEGRVRRYLKAVPAHQGEFHPKRVGPHYRRQNLTPHVIRDRGVVPVGLIYQGDGHSLHYYLRHPNSGRHFKPELTPWMDIGSRYIAGWWLGFSESAVQSLYSLSAALVTHDHVMALLHVDPGSGFKNKLMCDAVAGFAPRVGAEFMTALPGNARGKGDIEGWFRWFEERHGKFQPSYAGEEVPQEYLRNLEKSIERKQMHIPAWDEGVDGIRRYITAYNERNQDGLGKRSPAALWEKLERSPLHLPPAALVRPRELRMARSHFVELFNRTYRADELRAHEGKHVLVEYDLHNDSRVWLFDTLGRFIAEGDKVNAKPFISESRIADLQQRRLDHQVRRLQDREEQLRAQARPSLTHEDTLQGLENLGAAELPSDQPEIGDLPPLDLLDTDY
jgi:putative transposase